LRLWGKFFDPRIHEAVEMVDTTEGRITMCWTNCSAVYKYKDRLLRPAMVRVAAHTGIAGLGLSPCLSGS